uniref:Uncharacterized protein n=1 Tax=viral metagenome TaxID=1070528 RepID=A0A6C0F077_9ZZZZ
MSAPAYRIIRILSGIISENVNLTIKQRNDIISSLNKYAIDEIENNRSNDQKIRDLREDVDSLLIKSYTENNIKKDKHEKSNEKTNEKSNEKLDTEW